MKLNRIKSVTKPELESGDWYYDKNSLHIIGSKSTVGGVHRTWSNLHDNNGRVMAKAPKLMEALIELVKSINPQSIEETHRKKYVGSKTIPSDESVYNAIEVLIEAGVEFNK